MVGCLVGWFRREKPEIQKEGEDISCILPIEVNKY
jgi:hypothetical protein